MGVGLLGVLGGLLARLVHLGLGLGLAGLGLGLFAQRLELRRGLVLLGLARFDEVVTVEERAP